MNRRYLQLIIILVALVLLISGCLPVSYDHSALCEDRGVLFCEDFEALSQQVIAQPFPGSVWEISDDEWFSNWLNGLPVDGRSRRYLASIGLFDGYYESNSRALLNTQVIDLTQATTATLYFNLLYFTETSWDGMIVVATTDKGENWITLEPQGGYPGTVFYNGSLIQGYSGLNSYWTHEEIDLFPLLGQEIILGFYFVSDQDIVDYGIVLDDIVVDADTQANTSIQTLIRDLPDVYLVIPQTTIITTEIPRANILADTPCEGEQIETLKEGQRAYVKAVNETRDRYLVLHPESGNFCWIGQEDVWVDDQDWDFPRLSDKRPEDLYLYFCALYRSPFLADLACLSGQGAADEPPGLISYYLRSAYVEDGKIKTVLIDPGNRPGGNIPQDLPDPRVGGLDNMPKVETENGPGGILEVFINGVQGTCSLDSEKPGRVICENLSLNPAGPLGVDICWQGWDEGSRCPSGFAADQFGADCLILSDLGACTVECPEGYQFSPDEGLCIVNYNLAEENPELCPEGFSVNTQANCCVTPGSRTGLDCPSGYYYAPETEGCLRILGEGAECQEGYISGAEPGICILETGNASPVCAAFEVQFPKQEVTVKESTRCWKGPGSSYETVSSLKPFTVVEVLGVGEVEGFLVINNPRYQAPCWVADTDLYLEKLDRTILPVIPVEPDDTQPSQEKSSQGCLVAVDMTSAPKCVTPCPNPVKYPSPCAP